MQGRVLLSSSPSGSSVFIDGVETGKTPLTATLPAGQHTVEYRYRKNVRRIELTVVAGEDVSNVVDWTKRPVAPKRPKPASRSQQPGSSDSKPEVSSPAADGGVDPGASNLETDASNPGAKTGSPRPEAGSVKSNLP